MSNNNSLNSNQIDKFLSEEILSEESYISGTTRILQEKTESGGGAVGGAIGGVIAAVCIGYCVYKISKACGQSDAQASDNAAKAVTAVFAAHQGTSVEAKVIDDYSITHDNRLLSPQESSTIDINPASNSVHFKFHDMGGSEIIINAALEAHCSIGLLPISGALDITIPCYDNILVSLVKGAEKIKNTLNLVCNTEGVYGLSFYDGRDSTITSIPSAFQSSDSSKLYDTNYWYDVEKEYFSVSLAGDGKPPYKLDMGDFLGVVVEKNTNPVEHTVSGNDFEKSTHYDDSYCYVSNGGFNAFKLILITATVFVEWY